MIAEITGGLGALKTAIDILQGLKGAIDAARLLEVKIALQDQIGAAKGALLDAQEKHSAALARIEQLERQIMTFEKWEREQQRYELKALHDGAFAYALKPTEAAGEPPHYICAGCYQDDKKSVLQGETVAVGHLLKCSRCKSEVWLSSWNPPEPTIDYDPLQG